MANKFIIVNQHNWNLAWGRHLRWVEIHDAKIYPTMREGELPTAGMWKEVTDDPQWNEQWSEGALVSP